MASLLLGGLLTLTPTILQTAVQITQIVNPGAFTYDPNEYAIIKASYDHLRFKMSLVSRFLGLEARIRWVDLPEVPSEGKTTIPNDSVRNLYDNVRVICENYEQYLSEKVMPGIIVEFYASDVKDLAEIKINVSEIIALHGFPFEVIEGSMHQNRLQSMDAYLRNQHIGANPALGIMVNKLIDDSILALSRIAPGRVICPTSHFCIIPRDTKSWLVSTCPLKGHSVEYFQSSLKIKYRIKEDIWANCQKMIQFYRYQLTVTFEKSIEHKVGLWGGNSRTIVESTVKEYQIFGPEGDLDYSEPSLDQYSSVELRFELQGLLITGDLLAADVAKLHNLSLTDFNFGRLLSSGDYTLNNPIFGLSNIVQNTIGSAQHSIQLSITLLMAWLISLMNEDPTRAPEIKKRYLKVMSAVTLEDFCSISGRLLNDGRLKGCKIGEMELFWERLILDLNFMKLHIMRTKASKHIVGAVLSI